MKIIDDFGENQRRKEFEVEMTWSYVMYIIGYLSDGLIVESYKQNLLKNQKRSGIFVVCKANQG